MTEHLTEIEIYEVATGEHVEHVVTEHAESCQACAGEVAATRGVLASVERLEPAVETGPDLDRRLSRRLAASSPYSGTDVRSDRRARRVWWLAGAATAVVCFAAGVVTHAAWEQAPPAAVGLAAADPSGALAVQRAGSDYVAAIALMVADSERLSADDLRTGREVALAAMSGAAFELRLLGRGNRLADDVHQIVERARRDAAVESEP